MARTVQDSTATFGGFVRAALGNRFFITGFSFVAVVALAALISLVWVPYDVSVHNIANRFQTPDLDHWLGTDNLGRDILSMIMLGSRNSMLVAFVAVGIGAGIGIPIGLAAAAKGQWFDELSMRSADFFFAFPSIASAIVITAINGPDAINAIIAIGLFNIPVFARVARAGALTIWPREFILAARVAGKSTTRISLEHILPNIANLLIVQATIQFSLGILAEAGLSYFGLGAQPPTPSWGRMIFETQTMMAFGPHMVLIPGLAIVLTVLALNLMGDGLRDVLDPRLRV